MTCPTERALTLSAHDTTPAKHVDAPCADAFRTRAPQAGAAQQVRPGTFECTVARRISAWFHGTRFSPDEPADSDRLANR
jgi:hypothetical protein